MPDATHEGGALAVVIPAYKARYLGAALESLVRQTDRDFAVYVGDDHSDDDVAGVCSGFRGRLPLAYTRFPENLGGRSLASQWDRCVALAREPWVWLLGDDDVADAGCVAGFRAALRATGGRHALYRFPNAVIDAGGRVLRMGPALPPTESALEFAWQRLSGARSSYLSDHVFSRAALLRAGGFVDFPLGWFSDDATWLELAREGGICTVPEGRVRWRRSGLNLSSDGPERRGDKLRAHVAFLAWLRQRFEGERGELPARDARPPVRLDVDALLRVARRRFFHNFRAKGHWVGPRDMQRLAAELDAIWGGGRAGNLRDLALGNVLGLPRRLKRTRGPGDASSSTRDAEARSA